MGSATVRTTGNRLFIILAALISWLGLCSRASGQSGLITTIAGSGSGFFNGSYSGDGRTVELAFGCRSGCLRESLHRGLR